MKINSDNRQRRQGAVFSYEVRVCEVEIGSICLKVETLADFSKAIDEMFEFLQASGRSEFLTQYCPYFGEVWPSAVALGEYLLEHPYDWSKLSILELGCGLAIPSLVLAIHGARPIASDCHPDVPEFLRENLKLNPGAYIEYRDCDWRKENSFEQSFDLVIASDVLYDKDLPQALAERMASLVSPGGQLIVSDPGRAYLQDFVSELERHQIRTTTEIRKIKSPGFDEKEIFLIIGQRTPLSPVVP